MIEVLFDCGYRINFKNLDCEITAINIRYDKISYELTYLYNGEFKTYWIQQSELAGNCVPSKNIIFKKIGFINERV